MAKVLKGRRTDTITYDLKQRGRSLTGIDRSNVDMNAMINLINSAAVQEASNVGDLKGFYGHDIRKRFGMIPPETVLIDGKTVYLEPAITTKDVQATKDGKVTYHIEFFDNQAGEFVKRQYVANSIGFSTAVNYKNTGINLIPVGFFGFDAVFNANYPENTGDGQLYDGLFVPVNQQGLVSCFDSATDIQQLSHSEAMIARMLEQSIVRDFDSIHTQMGLMQMHSQALDQIDMLNTALSKKEHREQLQAQRQQDLYTGMVGNVVSFDSACEESNRLLEKASQNKSSKNQDTKPIQPKPRRLFGIF